MFKRIFYTAIWLGLLTGGILPAQAEFSPFKPLPAQPPIPADNPMTAAKTHLGRQLFFDPRLSAAGTHSCNSCHQVMGGGEDGRALPAGTGRQGTRNTPTVWNVGFYTIYGRDGRWTRLEEAVRHHLLDPGEMGNPTPQVLVARLQAIPGYARQFQAVFPGAAPITPETISTALAAYLRTLVAGNSPFDRFLRGEKRALSPQARRGYQEFDKIQCSSCHFWVNLSGPVPGLAFQMGEGFYELFPNFVGSEYDQKLRLLEDPGRYAVTQDEADRRLWRVASLRNVALTAPYFHNGSALTLDEAVRVMAKTQLKQNLNDQQVSDIVAFLHSLTGVFPRQTMPRLPPSPGRSVWPP